MRKNQIQNVIVHVPDSASLHHLADKVSEFHVDMIELRLSQTDLSNEQKISAIDKILEILKSREVDGIIK